MSKKRRVRKGRGKLKSIADPEFDRISVGYRTWICGYANCPTRTWSDGTPRYQTARSGHRHWPCAT